MLHYTRLKRLTRDMHSSLSGPFIRCKENEVLRIRSLSYSGGNKGWLGKWHRKCFYVTVTRKAKNFVEVILVLLIKCLVGNRIQMFGSILDFSCFRGRKQGILTERKGSVQLTSLLWKLVLLTSKTIFFSIKNLSELVNARRSIVLTLPLQKGFFAQS